MKKLKPALGKEIDKLHQKYVREFFDRWTMQVRASEWLVFFLPRLHHNRRTAVAGIQHTVVRHRVEAPNIGGVCTASYEAQSSNNHQWVFPRSHSARGELFVSVVSFLCLKCHTFLLCRFYNLFAIY